MGGPWSHSALNWQQAVRVSRVGCVGGGGGGSSWSQKVVL